MEGPVVEVVEERQHTCVRHVDGVGGKLVVQTFAVAIYVESHYGVLCCGACHVGRLGSYLVCAYEDVVNKQHEGVVRNAVDGHVTCILGDVVSHESPFVRQFHVGRFVDESEV